MGVLKRGGLDLGVGGSLGGLGVKEGSLPNPVLKERARLGEGSRKGGESKARKRLRAFQSKDGHRVVSQGFKKKRVPAIMLETGGGTSCDGDQIYRDRNSSTIWATWHKSNYRANEHQKRTEP